MDTSLGCYIIWTLLWVVTLYGHSFGLLHYMDTPMVCKLLGHFYGLYIIWTLFGLTPMVLLHYMDTPMVCYIIWTLFGHSYGFIIVYGHFYCLAVTTLLWFVNNMSTPIVLYIILTLLLSVTLYGRFYGLLNYEDTLMVCKL